MFSLLRRFRNCLFGKTRRVLVAKDDHAPDRMPATATPQRNHFYGFSLLHQGMDIQVAMDKTMAEAFFKLMDSHTDGPVHIQGRAKDCTITLSFGEEFILEARDDIEKKLLAGIEMPDILRGHHY